MVVLVAFWTGLGASPYFWPASLGWMFSHRDLIVAHVSDWFSICKEKVQVQVDGVLFGIQILSYGHIYLRKLTSQAANWVDDYQYLRICTRSPPSFAVTRFSPVFQERFRRRRWINSDRSAKVLRAGWEDWWPASREGWCFERFFTHI